MSKSLDNVLLAVGENDRDHVERLLDAVIAVAKPADATVYLLHVFTNNEYDQLMDDLDLDRTSGAIQPDELASRHNSVKTPAEKLSDLEINYEIRGVVGNPDTEVVRIADELNIDQLFIGGASRTPTGKAVFGDHAQQILLNANCPVTYIQRE
ncbi:universal stress protein [Haloarcula sp. 1CSR25-25]|uniref:universal stress protein n=1 Tax=Haloarcula sp. 1CSR25-25 TaxID=2862545 RepID=UPI0028941CCC|nr:universal stress protein [Haloarcula sp. 1CSR25-25]MDT3437304.1 universal stress protein [Haloarcula sp. 1CSR25-25]